MTIVYVLLGAAVEVGVGSKPTFAKKKYIFISLPYNLFFGCTCIRNDPGPEYLFELVYLQYSILFPSFSIHKIQVFLVYR